MLDPQSWLALAQALPVGRKSYAEHDCGSGKKLIIEHKPDGWSAWCFRCSEHGWVGKPPPSLAERVERLRAAQSADAAAVADIRPPMPAVWEPREWPSPERVWLYKAGFSNDRIRELGIYYAPTVRRVVLPIVDSEGRLIYWQARSLDPSLPKYINPPVDKPCPRLGSGSLVVLTEDYLSAARVAAVTEAWAIMGTSIPDRTVALLASDGRPVRIWFDPDSAGIKGARKAHSTLKALGIDVSIIRSDCDPKLLNLSQIREHLTERTND